MGGWGVRRGSTYLHTMSHLKLYSPSVNVRSRIALHCLTINRFLLMCIRAIPDHSLPRPVPEAVHSCL